MTMEDLFDSFMDSGKKEEEKPKEEPKKEEKKPELVAEVKPETKPEPKPEPKPKKEAPEEIEDEDLFGTKTVVGEVKPSVTAEVSAQEKIPDMMEIPVAPSEPVPEVKTDFVMEEEEESAKEVYTIYGLKGQGKTYLAFSFPGTIACMSFDHKSVLIKNRYYNKDSRIRVYDAIKFQNEISPEAMLASSKSTLRYINFTLDEIAKNPVDWVVIDGIEVMQNIAEMVMRYNNNVGPFQGVKNLNIWKERRMYIRQIHRKALAACKQGIIYTTYTEVKEIVEEGETITKKDVPKWIDVVVSETDDVLHVTIPVDKHGQSKRFLVNVDTSKTGLPIGKTFDVTDKGIESIWAERKVKK